MEFMINIIDKAKKKIVGQLISSYCKKSGVDIDIDIEQFSGKTVDGGDLKVHIEGELTISDSQLTAILIKGIL